MVKPRVHNETKEEKFKRIATIRTKKVLNALRVLGNCANKGTYEYSREDVETIFGAIEKQVKETKTRFNVQNIEGEFKL